jgi:hypothetical protein
MRLPHIPGPILHHYRSVIGAVMDKLGDLARITA